MNETIKSFCAAHWFCPNDVEDIKDMLHQMGYTDLTFKVPFKGDIIPATLIGKEEFISFIESQTNNLMQ